MQKLGTQKAFVFCLVFLIVFSSLALSVSAQTPLGVSEAGENDFSIVHISDTQYLSSTYPELFTNLTNWISTNKEKFNIQMVIHTGDIVDNPVDQLQWEQANSSMSILLESELPYCWNAGNHDKQFGDPENLWLGNNYTAFNIQTQRQKQYWVSDLNGGKNTAAQFTYSNTSFLVINLEYNPDQNVLDWMVSLLLSHNNSRVIVATHNYIDQNGQYPAENELQLNNRLDQFSNVFLVLSGHHHPNGVARARVENREELLFDRQDEDNKQGAAAARIITINTQTRTANVTTYLAYGENTFLSDAANHFNFSIKNNEPNKPSNDVAAIGLIAFFVLIISAVLALLLIKKHSKNAKQ